MARVKDIGSWAPCVGLTVLGPRPPHARNRNVRIRPPPIRVCFPGSRLCQAMFLVIGSMPAHSMVRDLRGRIPHIRVRDIEDRTPWARLRYELGVYLPRIGLGFQEVSIP